MADFWIELLRNYWQWRRMEIYRRNLARTERFLASLPAHIARDVERPLAMPPVSASDVEPVRIGWVFPSEISAVR